jgi:hypothetical protein
MEGYDATGKVLQDKELTDIANAKDETSTRYSADQGEQLRQAADAKDADGNPLYNVAHDGTNYTVTPVGGGDAGVIRQNPVTSFLGKEYDNPLSDQEKDSARLQAMSGVISKSDPIKAMQLRQQANQADQMVKQGVLTDFQINAAKRADDEAKVDKEVDMKHADFMKSRIKIGEDGQPLPLGDDDFVLGMKQRAMGFAGAGRWDKAQEAAKQGMDYTVRKVQAESAQRDADTKSALSQFDRGDKLSALSVYNKYVPDGSIATGIKENKDGSIVVTRKSAIDGVDLPPGQFKDAMAMRAAIAGLSDPNEVVKNVERTFQHDIESRRLSMEGGRLSIAKDAESRAKGKDDREQKRQDEADKAIADMDVADRSGDKAGYANARLRAMRNGVKMDKSEAQKADVKVGQLGDITVSQPTVGGGAVVTNYGPDMKPKGSVTVNSPGSSSQGPKAGEEKIIADGQHKGKTAVFDGRGWILKP